MMMRFRNGLNASDSLFNYITLITELAGLPTQALSSFFGQNADNNGAAVVPMETKQILNQTLAGLNITKRQSVSGMELLCIIGTTTATLALGIDNFAMNNIGGSTSAPAARHRNFCN